MNFYIADTHFGHEKVIEFCRRPFKNIEEMDEVIIKNWNEVVGHEDHVYILGDMIYRNKKEEIRIFETFLDTGDKVCN